MSDLREMMGRVAQAGRLAWIGLRPGRREGVVSVEVARVTASGLEGDRARAGKRAVSLMQAEHLAAIGGFLGRGPVAAADLRRNLVVSGLNLLAYRDREIAIGAKVVLRLRGPCAPCSRMEETFGPGGYAAVRGHGGMVAEVVQGGQIQVGDPVVLRPVV